MSQRVLCQRTETDHFIDINSQSWLEVVCIVALFRRSAGDHPPINRCRDTAHPLPAEFQRNNLPPSMRSISPTELSQTTSTHKINHDSCSSKVLSRGKQFPWFYDSPTSIRSTGEISRWFCQRSHHMALARSSLRSTLRSLFEIGLLYRSDHSIRSRVNTSFTVQCSITLSSPASSAC